MDTERAVIFKVGTQEAVQNVGDLRNNIRELNKELNGYDVTVDGTKRHVDGLTIGTEEYNAAVKELNVNQNALRNAMNGTTASMDDVVKSARGIGTTYNSLVAQMKSMKQEIRNVDVSTEEGKQKFAELAVQIDAVNDQLKAMDADMGNYQRNVGNYQSVWDGFGQTLNNMPPMLGSVKQAGENLNKSFKMLSTNPVMGVMALLMPIVMKLAEALGENEKVTAALQKVMKSLEPVMEVLEGLFEKIADVVARVVDWFSELMANSGDTFKNIIAGAVGVGNTLLQYILTPVRSAIAAFKGLGNIIKEIQNGNWAAVKENAAEAWNGIKDAFKQGFSFKENFQRGKEIGEQFLAGLEGTKKKAKKTGSGIGKEVADGINAGLNDEIDEVEVSVEKYIDALNKANAKRKKDLEDELKDGDRLLKQRLAWNDLLAEDDAEKAAKAYELQRAANEQRLALLNEYIQAAEEAEDYAGAAEAYKQRLDLEVQMEQDAFREKQRIDEMDEKKKKERQKNIIAVYQASASAISGILNTIADAYEDEAEGNEEAAKKTKALRITAGVIDTISGALAAYTSAQSLGFPMGPIIGAINAAAVTATGIAQIAKIKSTKIGSGDSAGSGVSVPAASVPAPATAVDLPEVRNVTTATEEDRMERMASKTKVYILNSDLEANDEYHQTQVAEATF